MTEKADKLKALRDKYPVGEPLPLLKNRDLILQLIVVKNTLKDYADNLVEKITDSLEEPIEDDEDEEEEELEEEEADQDDDEVESSGGTTTVYSADFDDYINHLGVLNELFGINFDQLPGCPVPLIHLASKFDDADDLLAFFNTLIDWLIQVDLDVSSIDYKLLNIQISSEGVPMVFGYNSGMF